MKLFYKTEDIRPKSNTEDHPDWFEFYEIFGAQKEDKSGYVFYFSFDTKTKKDTI